MSKTEDFYYSTLKQVSQSHLFQQYLRLNPRLAERAQRDRDQVVLEFLRKPKSLPLLPDGISELTGTVESVVPPTSFFISCDTTVGFQIGPGKDGPPVYFDFRPFPLGNAVVFCVQALESVMFRNLLIGISTLTDNCTIYINKPGTDLFDPDPSHYFQNPIYFGGDRPGTDPEVFLVEQEKVDDIRSASDFFSIVIYHRGLLPVASGMLQLGCMFLEPQLLVACPGPRVPNFIGERPSSVQVELKAFTPANGSELPSTYFEFGTTAGTARSVFVECDTSRRDVNDDVKFIVNSRSGQPFAVYYANFLITPRDPRVSKYSWMGTSNGSQAVEFKIGKNTLYAHGEKNYVVMHNLAVDSLNEVELNLLTVPASSPGGV